MSGDLYEMLGSSRDATPDALRFAFRRKAMKTHPDHGGNAEEFAAIERAYRVLSNPETRARYDATGEVPTREPDNSEAAALGVIGNMLVMILGSAQSTGDPLLAMRQSLAANIDQATRAIVELERSMMRCEKLSARFKTKRERDPIKDMIGSQVAQLRNQIEGHRQAVVTMERAQAILKDYEFEAEQNPMQAHMQQMDQMRRMMAGAQANQAAGWGW